MVITAVQGDGDGRIDIVHLHCDLYVTCDASVEHIDDSRRIAREIRVVGNHDNRVAHPMEEGQLFHDDVARSAIEISSWLVCKDDAGLVDKRASNRDTLHLAARKLPWHVILTFLQMERLEYFARALETLGTWHAEVGERKGDIFEYAHAVDEVEVLEYDANLL